MKITALFWKIIAFFKHEVRKILELKDTQHAVAGGVAIGIFFGFTPLFGLKMLLSIGVAWLFGCNIIAAAIAVSLHDIILPILPIVLRFQYQIGYWVLNHHLPPPLPFEVHRPKISEFLKWTTFFGIGLPLLIGSFFFALPSAIASYAVTLGILESRKRRKEKAAQEDIKQD